MPDERIVPMRLQRFLARAGVASRRGSENPMTAGRVRVNGVVVSELGSKVDPARDVVEVDGIVVRLADTPTYLVLDKPAGYLTTMSDPHGRPCVASLVPVDRHPGLFPVGRLDMDTTGLPLFTTDGDAAQEMLHPSRHVDKHYVARVRGVPTEGDLDKLRRGITLEDGPCQPAEADLIERVPGGALVGIRIREGRKHQVKRMLSAIGHGVEELRRDSFGPVTARGLVEGSWRYLDEDEIESIHSLLRGGVAVAGGDKRGEGHACA